TIRQNEPLADYVFYLPLDGPVSSKKFLTITAPEMVFFVKYDIWYYYIKYCKQFKIPVYFISSVFRQSQLYFKWYGYFFNAILRRVTHFFVQNQSSLELLYNNSIPQVTVTGDTRFDRVFENSLKAPSFPEIEQLRGTGKMFIAGSTWPADEQYLAKLYAAHKSDFRFVIVPHEVSEQSIKNTVSLFSGAVRYSQWDQKSDVPVLIIDRIGMLSALYKYADIAYIGGGFGKGIHNILEAVVFGPPVLFGPVYKKFREANDLIRWKSAFTFKSYKELNELVTDLSHNEDRLTKIKEINLNYIAGNRGATDLIINYLKLNHSL
ncbi:MAG TPA: glycosyltransferase N-terminal domain-containing protein, partial [Bacteroidia bacterium]|nr:glycosyltransferase N-terminal domain-containing protein [Bacteroidia bacterium]